MDDLIVKELDLLLDWGVITENRLAELRGTAADRGVRPLVILREEGRLSEEETFRLRNRVDRIVPDNFGVKPLPADDSLDAPTLHQEDISGAPIRTRVVDESDEETGRLTSGLMLRGRYQIMVLAGRGGMGEVYQAYDFQLKRKVAIKFLNGSDPDQIERFIHEARAQAGVDHEHICKVFEVDQEGDRPFIVMQYIPGTTLDRAARKMTLEQKILVLRQVAEGVHEAHRRGLVHRDLKPGNIMVVRTDQGVYKPFILDFGLAYSVIEAGRTNQGELLGTPDYMAPEQALGLLDQIDRRTDVYSLGATLYRLLTDEPPMGRGRGAEVLIKVQREEPKPPRRKNPGIPRDLETITLKCLEKRSDTRYASARALADDLERYLNGDPILAKPAGLFYRFQKKILKNKAVAVVAAISFLALAALLVYAVHLRWQSKVREELARVFTEHVKEVEALSRHAFLSRRHDIGPDRALLSRHMEAIRGEMQRAGLLGAGLGHYSLGKAHLVQGDLQSAHRHLMLAWNNGYREPRAAYALSLTLGGIYREKLGQIQLLPEKVDREKQRAELERAYLRPALDFIGMIGEFQAESSAYPRALLAFYDNRLEKALELLSSDRDVPSWFYETKVLEGDIFRELAGRNRDAGDYDSAKEYFDKALAAFEHARSIAESDFKIYRARGQIFLELMTLDIFSKNDIDPYLERGFHETEWALEIDQGDPDTWLLKAKLHAKMAQHLAASAKDPTERLDQAEEAALCALATGGDPSLTMLELGQIHWRRAQWLNDKRQDSSASIQAASLALNQVDAHFHDYGYHHSLGVVHLALAGARARSGEDARESYDRAADAFRNALALMPDRIGLYNSLAICLFRLSEQDNLQVSPMALLREATTALDAALRIQPDHVVLHYQQGRTYLRMAQNGNVDSGLLDEELLGRTLRHYNRALELNPKMVHLYNVLGRVYYIKAIHEWEEGRPPDEWFDLSIATYAKGRELAPNSRRIYQNMAWVYYYRGKLKVREGRNPESDFSIAVSLSNRALEEGKDIEAILCLASVDRLRAEYALQTGHATPFFEAARVGLEEVLVMNPNYGEGYRSLGRLFTLEARRIRLSGQDPGPLFSMARAALDQALAREPESPWYYLADARWYLEKSVWLVGTGQSPAVMIEQGLNSTERALAIRPGFAEAILIASGLKKVGPGMGIGQESDLQTATVAGLLDNHPNLRYQWRRLLLTKR